MTATMKDLKHAQGSSEWYTPPEYTKLVHQVMDGSEPDLGGLDKEAQDYVKTAKVLLGHSLYSDSWLEL